MSTSDVRRRPGRHLASTSRRRAMALLAASATLASMSLWWAPAASAADGVSSTPNFELEVTNPLTTGALSDPNAVASSTLAGDDWENVYNRSLGASSPDSASASRFLTDGINSEASETLFTGGQSKDPENVTNWRWASGSGVQDKNDIEHAYAARYNAAGTNPAYLFFGLDRYATDGSATLGFWFLKGKTAPVTVNGVRKFSGTGHQNNDLLVQINYSNGGTVPTVAVSKWLNGALSPLASSDAALCGASSTQTYCASTNRKSESSPWVFALKGASGDSDFAERTFFEGGIDLASFQLDRDCFSTFVAETRSSNPFTSTLSDFVMGDFASCAAVMSTSPSAGESETTAVSPGTSVTDTATVTGQGISAPPFPSSATTAPGTGNKVNFYLCGPLATGTCSSTSNLISSNNLAASTTQGVSTATSSAVNTTASPLAPGRYCWHATWDGDVNYPAIGAENNAAAECFVVRTIPTTTVTTPSDGSGTALSGAQPVGTTIYDRAVVTASAAGGGAITGNVAFYLCNPDQVVGGVCPATGGTAVGNPSVTAVSGASPPQATALSTGTAANRAGTWCFRATFTPTGSTYTGSGDGTTGECVVISKADTRTVTTPTLLSDGSAVSTTSFLPVGSQVYDHAVVSSANLSAGAPTGSVHFFVCGPTQLTSGLCSAGGTDLGSVNLAGQPDLTSTANSSTVTANAVGRWCFRGVYSGDSNFNGSSDSAVNECFTVKDTTTATSAQRWLPNDSATITTTAASTPFSGTIGFVLYETSDCTGTPVTGQSYSETKSGTHTITSSTSNTTYLVSATKTVSWLVTFTSDNENLVGSSSHCETSTVSVTN
ncbi:MAG TPA: hypothetical protein VMZ11_02095 [Mycobacteriales bacterium]|nr:hypothetical protein [Mycobacteriales bacterium]